MENDIQRKKCDRKAGYIDSKAGRISSNVSSVNSRPVMLLLIASGLPVEILRVLPVAVVISFCNIPET